MHGERRTLRFRRVTRLGSYLLHLGAVRFCNVVHDVSSFASVPNQRPTVDGCTPRCRAICLFDQPSTSRSCAAFARRALTDTTVTGGVATSARPTSCQVRHCLACLRVRRDGAGEDDGEVRDRQQHQRRDRRDRRGKQRRARRCRRR